MRRAAVLSLSSLLEIRAFLIFTPNFDTTTSKRASNCYAGKMELSKGSRLDAL
jgi:hypothetical protein